MREKKARAIAQSNVSPELWLALVSAIFLLVMVPRAMGAVTPGEPQERPKHKQAALEIKTMLGRGE